MAKLLPRILSQFGRLSLQNVSKINVNGPRLVSSISLSARRYSTEPTPYEIVDEELDQKTTNEIIAKVNEQVEQAKQGRLFAIVHLAGKQLKITEGDVVIVEGYWPPECGDKISLDKVLVAGARDFTLIGRPIIQKGLINIEATVIEKTLSHTKTHFRKKRRKQYMRINFYRIPQTYLRINSIQVKGELNNPPQVQGLENVVF
ncbi:39S ribosomal protein L21, mitochondrial [Anthonomus grandis grandis]|uniref:39S ribosomal protein L21, mitochondrial n=1 Tax=Anthonomus grandis grandis TaxID=2921223 RepID=UPI002164FF6A|nr:39S ribosomal protein L21, mitochondrial [Anthonomus grandis grandis]